MGAFPKIKWVHFQKLNGCISENALDAGEKSSAFFADLRLPFEPDFNGKLVLWLAKREGVCVSHAAWDDSRAASGGADATPRDSSMHNQRQRRASSPCGDCSTAAITNLASPDRGDCPRPPPRPPFPPTNLASPDCEAATPAPPLPPNENEKR